ncbi:MAG: gluconate 5-dehydrogenase [Phycisphaeraceae bacterium]|nr:gluconate 5-dehydrogenase [Phycisphaeraceae bacterium]
MGHHVMELFRLNGRTALVTGGARNLGRDMAEALAEAGADVAITSRHLDQAEATAEALASSTGRTVRPYQLEVTDEAQVVDVIGRVISDFGQLDVLVNNAGNIQHSAHLEQRTREDWDYTFAANTTSTFLCAREAARHMKPRGTGTIINIASISGMMGKDRSIYDGLDMVGVTIDYSAAKGAVINMTRDLACYLGPHGIRVNSISTSGFERNQPEPFLERYRPQHPLGRIGEDGKDIKGAVVYLASEAAAWVSGHNLVLDGGFSAW